MPLLSEVLTMNCGWFVLIFSQPELVNWVLTKYWHIEMNPVLLKRWSPMFDPDKENAGVGSIWVQLPGLLMQFWNEATLRYIGADLGTS